MTKLLPTVASLALTAAAAALCGGAAAHEAPRSPMLARPESSIAGKPRAADGGRMLQFSGYEWRVKSSRGRVGPGSNYFSASPDNVWVDEEGRLHLRITRREDAWQCAEVISQRSFGRGTYRFYLASPVGDLDANAVLGLFTWSDAPAYAHREIDIEFSRWGQPAADWNGQFVIQPYTRPQNITRFTVPSGLAASTHTFEWRRDRVFCQSLKGHHASPPDASSLIHEWTFTQGIPQAGSENARINLWLTNGRAPRADKEVEVIIARFEFAPSLR